MIKRRKINYSPIPSEDIARNKNSVFGIYHNSKKLKKQKNLRKKYIIIGISLLIIIPLIIILIHNLFKEKKLLLIKNNELKKYIQEKNNTEEEKKNYFNNNETKFMVLNKTKHKPKNIFEEMKNMQKYIFTCVNGTIINPNVTFYKSDNPKISVVIPMFNAEGYINNGIVSIQNQDFTDIEIIIIDDGSKDNSVNYVKELMKKDPRIILYQNEENKGTLYSKTKGVLNAKGKYVLVGDQDDMYVQTDAFSTMYEVLESNNLDILGFSALYSDTIRLWEKRALSFYKETPVIYQPHVSRRMFKHTKSGPVRTGDVIWSFIFKTELFIKSIKQIDDKFMNTKMNCHEDFLLFFLLTRNAYNLKYIKRVFYVHLYWKGNNDTKILFSKMEKKVNKHNLKCMSFLNYIEFLLMKTNNTIEDKRIASAELKNWYIKNPCKNNTYIEERGRYVCNLFIENEYIEDNIKKEIKLFLMQK